MFKAMSKKGSFNQSPSPRNQTLNQAFMMNPTLAPGGTNNRSVSHQDSGSYHPGQQSGTNIQTAVDEAQQQQIMQAQSYGKLSLSTFL